MSMSKKKWVALLLSTSMVASVLAGCGNSNDASESSSDSASASEETATTASDDTSDDASAQDEGKENYKIGITIQSLENAYWAGVMGKLQGMMDEKGYECTIVDCKDTPATQIDQIENFITSDCDLIMVHPSDANSIEEVCGQALDAGIKVMCWDDPMTNTNVNWVLDNTELGNHIGKLAADFINEHYTADHKAQVCVIGYPSTKILLERQNGIEDGLEENCNDNYEIVAEIEGLEANDAQTNVETVLQAHPDCTVYVGIGAGAMIGANEALLQKYGGAGNIPDDVAVIATDVTLQPLKSLQAGNEAIRALIGTEGSNTDTAEVLMGMFEDILNGKDYSDSDRMVYRSTMEITSENIEEILSGM